MVQKHSLEWYEQEYGGYYDPYEKGLITTQDVFEYEPEITGVLDSNGNMVFKPRNKIGFI